MSCQRCVALEGALLKIIETHKNADYYDTASNCEMKMLEVAKEAIASPTLCKHDADVTCSNCRGDSAGPEKHVHMPGIRCAYCSWPKTAKNLDRAKGEDGK